MFRRVENLKKWTRNTLHGWFLRSPQGLSSGRERARPTVEIRAETLASGRGAYIAQRLLSVVPTGCRYYQRSLEIEPEMSYRYTDPGSVLPGGLVVPTRRQFYRVVRKFQQRAHISTTDLVSVVPAVYQFLRLIEVLD
jgi:hypothetical protein